MEKNILSECGSFLRKNHIRVTPQRLAVYSVLHDSHQHLNVSQIYQKVKKTIPTISLATVYSILDNFREIGLVRELTIETERSVYDAGVHPHHHLLCKKCKKIFDISPHHIPPILPADINGHHIDSFEIYFYGNCKDCS
jgi:Fur family peroxide stress response transcriptional regulator